MGALSLLFRQPSSDTNVTAELGAMWAEMSIPQFLHAYETSEHLGQGLNAVLVIMFRTPISSCHCEDFEIKIGNQKFDFALTNRKSGTERGQLAASRVRLHQPRLKVQSDKNK